SGFDEVAGDVDAQHVRPAARRGQGRGAVSTAEIEHLEPRLHAEALHYRLTALTHAVCDSGEITLLPECLVRIHASAPSLDSGHAVVRSSPRPSYGDLEPRWPRLTRRPCRPAASSQPVSWCHASVRGIAQWPHSRVEDGRPSPS